MSTTIETTPRSDVLSHAETRTDRQAENCKKLTHKVAVITGGSTGMGLATAKRFVQEGTDHVFITGRRKDVLGVAVAEIGDKATGIPGRCVPERPRSLVRISQRIWAKHRRGIRECRHRAIGAIRYCGREILRPAFRCEYEGPLFHGSEIAPPVERRRLDHLERIDRHREGLLRDKRL